MLKSILLAFVAITLCLGEYSSYSVVRLFGVNETDVLSFYDASLDVWATNKIESWADVMIHNDQLANYLDLYPQYTMVFDNVQNELDRHYEENEQAKASAVGQPYAFNYFPPYPDVLSFLDEMISKNSDVAKSVSLGNSYAGNEIKGIQFGSNPSAPLFFIHCTIHAREWISTTTCCYIIEQILTVDTNLLQYYNWVIVPVLNVDGYIYTQPGGDRLWRKNRQPNSGSSCVGTDLNRNFGVGWSGPGASPNECAETYYGSKAFSGPEIERERVFISNWPGTLGCYADIHAYGGYFMSPWGYTYSLPPEADYDEMNRIMTAAVAAIRSVNGRSYYYGSVANTIYQASGGSNDWTYGDSSLRIIPSFALECSGTSFTPPTSSILPVGKEVYAGIKEAATQAFKTLQK